MKLIPQERVQNCTVEQVIDVPVVKQGRVPAIQTPQNVLFDRVVDVPVVTQRHVPLEVPQIQFIDKAMDVQSSCRDRCPSSRRCRRQ